MKDLVVFDGSFWVRVDGLLSKPRLSEVAEDAGEDDNLIAVGKQLWAKIVSIKPSKIEEELMEAIWDAEEVKGLKEFQKKFPKIK